MPDFSIENSFTGTIGGIDEVGYGSLAGPVISAIICFPDKNTHISGINDSKKLTPKKRKDLFDQLTSLYPYAIGSASVAEINYLNILEATKLAHLRAIENLKIKLNFIIIDGIHTIKSCHKMHAFKKGDSISTSIAAASVIAKVSRDAIMDIFHELYPNYMWTKNKGYGTTEHIEAIKKFGLTKLHRTKFVQGYTNFISSPHS